MLEHEPETRTKDTEWRDALQFMMNGSVTVAILTTVFTALLFFGTQCHPLSIIIPFGALVLYQLLLLILKRPIEVIVDDHGQYFLVVRNHQVIMASSSLIWKSELLPGDALYSIYLNMTPLRLELSATIDGKKLCIPFEMNLHGEQPSVSWQGLYDAVLRPEKEKHVLVYRFFHRKMQAQLEAHKSETTALLGEFVDGKTEKRELMNRLSEMLNKWDIFPEFPGMRPNIIFFNRVNVSDKSETPATEKAA